jgi:hypothetical protein
MSFHVPEAARITSHPQLASTYLDGDNGAFVIESPEPGWQLWLICSDGRDVCAAPEGADWEHVSVHAARKSGISRTPNWREMAYVKEVCWDPEDVVMQLHPRRSQYVNAHPHVLHLWRPRHLTIPEPPAILVGPLKVAP